MPAACTGAYGSRVFRAMLFLSMDLLVNLFADAVHWGDAAGVDALSTLPFSQV